MGVARLYRITTPYTEDEVGELDYEQSADVMYLAHRSHVPGKLSRYDHIDWRFSNVTFGATIAAPASPAAVATHTNTGTGYTRSPPTTASPPSRRTTGRRACRARRPPPIQ
jgi:hypothetical protein